MKQAEIAEFVKSSFLPIELATDDQAVAQCVVDAIRWYDRESADIVLENFTYNGQNVMELPDRVDTVIHVYTDRVVSEIFTAQTLLLGVTILDYDIMTLAMKQNHLGDLRTFLASRFRWRWVRPNLYVDGMTTAVNTFVVEYLRHYDWEDDTAEYTGKALDWITRYATALVKQREGRILRMGSIIGAPLDGSELVSEGKVEQTEIMQQLRQQRPLLGLSRTF